MTSDNILNGEDMFAGDETRSHLSVKPAESWSSMTSRMYCLLVLVFFLSGCGGVEDDGGDVVSDGSGQSVETGESADADSAELMVDIYSGRENPSYVLEGDDLSKLVSIVAGLPATNVGEGDDGLGFRGFVVTPVEYQGERYNARFEPSMVTLTPEGVEPGDETASIELDDGSGQGFNLLLSIVDGQDPPTAALVIQETQ